jgi:hypothetical protein
MMAALREENVLVTNLYTSGRGLRGYTRALLSLPTSYNFQADFKTNHTKITRPLPNAASLQMM